MSATKEDAVFFASAAGFQDEGGGPFILFCFALAVLAITATVLLGFVVFTVRRRSRQEKSFKMWTRFQRMMIICLLIDMLSMVSSIAEMVLVWTYAPDHIRNTAAIQPGSWNSGPLPFLASVLEISTQIIIQMSVYLYYFILVDRYTTFKLFMPGGGNAIIPRVLIILGTFSAMLLPVDFVLVNTIIPATDVVAILAMVTQNLLLLFVIIMELVCGIYLCKATFSNITYLRQSSRVNQRNGRPVYGQTVMVYGRSSGYSRNSQEQQQPPPQQSHNYGLYGAHQGAYPPPRNSIAGQRENRYSDAQLGYPGMDGSYGQQRYQPSLYPVQPQGHHAQNLDSPKKSSVWKTAMKERPQRHAIMMLALIIGSDLFSLGIYLVGSTPGFEQYCRQIEMVARSSVGVHMMLSLLFLESFREIVRPSNTVGNATSQFSSVGVSKLSAFSTSSI